MNIKEKYCLECGAELVVTYEENVYLTGCGDVTWEVRKRFDEQTGEEMFKVVGTCPNSRHRRFLFWEYEEPHYSRTLARDYKKPRSDEGAAQE